MIIDKIKEAAKELFTNRYLTTLSIITVVLAIALVIYVALAVRPSELQLVTHYSVFGITHLYRDQWFYLLSFAVLAVLVAMIHIALAVKLYIHKGHSIALIFAWLGIAIILFAWVTASSIINVWSPL
jgi:hypothetical protein